MGPSDYSSHKSHCDVEIQNKEANLASDSYPSNSRTCEVEKSQENVLDEQRACKFGKTRQLAMYFISCTFLRNSGCLSLLD